MHLIPNLSTFNEIQTISFSPLLVPHTRVVSKSADKISYIKKKKESRGSHDSMGTKLRICKYIFTWRCCVSTYIIIILNARARARNRFLIFFYETKSPTMLLNVATANVDFHCCCY